MCVCVCVRCCCLQLDENTFTFLGFNGGILSHSEADPVDQRLSTPAWRSWAAQHEAPNERFHPTSAVFISLLVFSLREEEAKANPVCPVGGLAEEEQQKVAPEAPGGEAVWKALLLQSFQLIQVRWNV